MTLFGLAATVIRPTALVLNILVQRSVHFNFGGPVISLGNYFGRSRCSQFPPRIFGGYLQPSAGVLRILIGIVLLFSATRLIFRRAIHGDGPSIETNRDWSGSRARISLGSDRKQVAAFFSLR